MNFSNGNYFFVTRLREFIEKRGLNFACNRKLCLVFAKHLRGLVNKFPKFYRVDRMHRFAPSLYVFESEIGRKINIRIRVGGVGMRTTDKWWTNEINPFRLNKLIAWLVGSIVIDFMCVLMKYMRPITNDAIQNRLPAICEQSEKKKEQFVDTTAPDKQIEWPWMRWVYFMDIALSAWLWISGNLHRIN